MYRKNQITSRRVRRGGGVMYKARINWFEHCKKWAVTAESIEDFCDKYHRPFGDDAWGKSARKEWLETAQSDMKKHGFIWIPSSTTTTGKHCAFYGKGVQK